MESSRAAPRPAASSPSLPLASESEKMSWEAGSGVGGGRDRAAAAISDEEPRGFGSPAKGSENAGLASNRASPRIYRILPEQVASVQVALCSVNIYRLGFRTYTLK